MKYRYYATGNAEHGLPEYLDINDIKYKIVYDTVVVSIIGPTQKERAIIHELADKGQLLLLISSVFDKRELESAKLLNIRPISQQFDIVNYEEAYISRCSGEMACVSEQIDILKVSNLPNSKSKTHFWAESSAGWCELFTTRHVYDLIQASDIKGAVFKNVIVRGGKYSEDSYQLTSDAVIGRECVELGYGEKELRCRNCARTWYFLDNNVQLHLDFSKFELNKDIYITETMFGYNVVAPLYIISQKLYRLLNENKLLKNVIVEPVFDESK
jgi:hypothetical protein